MGTKIEYYINFLSSSVDSNNLTVGGVDAWEHFQNKRLRSNHHRIGINKLPDPMERKLGKNSIESIKKTMLMHEDIFKHQVRELHRLYSVQKMLTDELKNEIRQKKLRTSMHGLGISNSHIIDQNHQTVQTSYGPELQVQCLRDDLCSRERSGSCSGDNIKMQRGFDLERPAEEDIRTGMRISNEGEAGPSSRMALQSCKIGTDGSDEEIEVDLTLSIGGSKMKKDRKSHFSQLGCLDSANGKNRELNSSASFKSDRVVDCSGSATPMSSSSVTFDQERKGPHWLSQGLKL